MSLFDTQSLFPLKSTGSVYGVLRFPIQSSSILLKRAHCQNLLETLQVILPEPSYTQYYYPAIEQFVNYVQVLPARPQGLFSELEGLLDYSLSHATYTLTTSLGYLYPDQKDFHKVMHSAVRSAELYAAFTAALFKEIKLLVQAYEVSLYTKDKHKIKIWNPFEGPMSDSAGAFFMSFKSVDTTASLSLLNSSLTSTILYNHLKTRPGFLSITKYPQVLEDWLAALIEEEHRVPPESIISLLPFGAKKAIEKRLEKRAWSKRMEQLQLEHVLDHWGERFLSWLREKAASGELAVNHTDEIGVRQNKAGLLVSRAELLAFSKMHQIDPDKVEKQFREITSVYAFSTESTKSLSNVMSTNQGMRSPWILLYNPALIFAVGQLPPLFLGHHLMQPVNRSTNYQSNPH